MLGASLGIASFLIILDNTAADCFKSENGLCLFNETMTRSSASLKCQQIQKKLVSIKTKEDKKKLEYLGTLLNKITPGTDQKAWLEGRLWIDEKFKWRNSLSEYGKLLPYYAPLRTIIT